MWESEVGSPAAPGDANADSNGYQSSGNFAATAGDAAKSDSDADTATGDAAKSDSDENGSARNGDRDENGTTANGDSYGDERMSATVRDTIGATPVVDS